MIHIAPWVATMGLFSGAAKLLTPGAPLFLYGPFIRPGHPLEPSNRAFDHDLRRRDPRSPWSVRRRLSGNLSFPSHAEMQLNPSV